MPGSLLLRNVRPLGNPLVDVLVKDGRIEEMGAGLQADPNIIALEGHHQLLLPGLVNAHAHVDKNLLGLPWRKNDVPGTRIRDFVDHERKIRREMNLSAKTQSAQQLRLGLTTGTTHVRTHVDIDTEAGLKHFEGVMQTRDEFKDLVTMQLVAFPQSGMLIRSGTVELLEEAVKMGAECIGGLDPSTVDRDPAKHLDIVFGIADKYSVEVDIHLHEPGMLGAFAVELIAERTRALGLHGRVTISHVFCLGMVDETYLAQLLELMLECRITIMSLGSGVGSFPPLKRLHQAGVPLCTGTDGIRDTWGPYNSVDMMDRVKMLGYRSGLRKDEDIEMLLGIATHSGAKVMSDGDYGLQVGKRADLVVVAGDTPAEAIMELPPRTYVIKNGILVAQDGKYLGRA